jgi:hypothetical protein
MVIGNQQEMDMNLIQRLRHFEQGGTVENPKALLREAIAELQRLQRAEQARLTPMQCADFSSTL